MKGSDRSTTKNLYIPRDYLTLANHIVHSSKLLGAEINCKSYHAIIWLAAYIGIKEISQLEFESLKELEELILNSKEQSEEIPNKGELE